MRKTIKPFLVRVRQNSDETLDDWYLRLEIQNYHADSVWAIILAEGFGGQIGLDKLNFVEDPALFDFLAYMARLERGELQILPYKDYAEILSIAGKKADEHTETKQSWVRFFDKAVCICPLCLQEQLYIRKYWHLGFMAICSKHRAWLISICLSCGHAWKRRDVLANQCPHCQNEATVFSENLIVEDESLLEAHRYLDEILNQQSNSEPSHFAVDKSHHFFLLYGLSELVSKLSADWSYHLQHHCSTIELEFCSPKRLSNFLNYATAFQAIHHWPESFYRFLDQYRLRSGNQEQRGLNHEFGPLYSTWIKNRWADSNFAFVQEAFKTYLEMEFVPYDQFKNAEFIQKNPSVLTENNFVTLEQAAIMLNESLVGVLDFVFSGHLHLFKAKYEPIEYLKKSEVEQLARSLR